MKNSGSAAYFLFFCIIVGVLVSSCRSVPDTRESIVFSAMGCGPYDGAAERALRRHMTLENAEGESEFIIHLGDIVSGSKARAGEVRESDYINFRNIMTEKNRIPTYLVIGDNEWNDRVNPAEGWEHWTRHLMHFEKRFSTLWETNYQSERPENFAFVHKSVLFVGITLVGGRVHDREEWKRVDRFGADWIEQQFGEHRDAVKAAVIFCQAKPNPEGKHKRFMQRFMVSAKVFEKPVLFLHADGHTWLKERSYEAQNVLRVQTDKISPEHPPVQVTIDLSEGVEFRFDRRRGRAWRPPGPNRKPK